MQYTLNAKVRRIVIDDVTLKVNAPSLNVAITKARDVLEVFPAAPKVPGVPFCFINHREPFDVDILSIEEEHENVRA